MKSIVHNNFYFWRWWRSTREVPRCWFVPHILAARTTRKPWIFRKEWFTAFLLSAG